jgi:propanediol dehydratase small subunit
MSKKPLSIEDYPIAEKRPELVRTASGKSLDELTLDAVVEGEIAMDDIRITPHALHMQAEIARAVGREALAANFSRAAEMAVVPQDVIMEMYELLRPGRAKNAGQMVAAAAQLRNEYGAEKLAEFFEEAAEIYEKRGLFKFRF